MRFGAFLDRFGDALARAVVRTYPPLYDAEARRASRFDLGCLLRRPLGGQADAIRATAFSLQQHGSTNIVGEMGTGKSMLAAAAAHLAGCRRVLVLCPPHMVRKWQREIAATVPGARVALVRTITDLERVRSQGGRQFVVLSREQAKLGYRWVPAVVPRPARDELGGLARDERGDLPRLLCCPTCFEPATDEEGVPLGRADLAAKKCTCRACGGALWQADRTGPRRFPLADYVRRRLTDHFDLLVADECFPAGTQVATPSGPVPIERLQVGDRVLSYRDERLVERTVVRTIRKPLREQLVRVRHQDGFFVCTGNHHIFTADGYVEAAALTPGTRLVCLGQIAARQLRIEGGPVADHREAMRALPGELHVLAAPEARGGVLQPRLRGPGARREVASPSQSTPTDHREQLSVVRGDVRASARQAAHVLQQELRVAGADGQLRPPGTHHGGIARKDAAATGCFVGEDAPAEHRPRHPGEGVGHPAWSDLRRRTRRERVLHRSARSALPGSGLVYGVLHPDGTQIVALREGGPRRAHPEDRGGAGWRLPPDHEAAQPRPPEGRDAFRAGLDGGPILELGDRSRLGGRGQPASGCRTSKVVAVERLTTGSDGFVYDLEVEDTHRYFAEGVLVSNCQEFKARGSAQGLAAGTLAEACGKTLTLTGTIFGGYSSTLFYLLWRFSPAVRAEFGYRDEPRWVGRYGVVERITKQDPDVHLDDGRHSRRRSYLTRTVEKPGVSPAVLFHLIHNTVFLRLADVARDLPPYSERIALQPLDRADDPAAPSQAGCYQRLALDLRQAVLAALQHGSKRLLAAYMQALLAYPDGCVRGETVVDAASGAVLAAAPPLSPDRLYPKERALLELVGRERARGRRVLVYITNTETRDLSPRLCALLGQAGFQVAILKAGTVPPDRREDWVAARTRAGAEVLLCHPRLVQTGLDYAESGTGGNGRGKRCWKVIDSASLASATLRPG